MEGPPAPPHDDTGHTWDHPDQVLFGITKKGLVPPNVPKNYETDMPAFQTNEEIWVLLGHIKSHLTSNVLAMRAEMLRNAIQSR